MRDGREDVGILDQRQLGRLLAGLLDLLAAVRGRSPVGDRRGEHRDVGRQRRLDRGQHVARGLDLDHRDAGRIGHVHRPGDERHRCTG